MIWSHSAIELEINRTNTIGKPLKSQFNYENVNGTCMKGKWDVIKVFQII
jgi:hypothetical protein